MTKYKKLLKQVLFFGIVGVGSLVIDFTVTVSLYNLLHIPPFIAGSIGFLSAFFFNFPINRKHVFNHSQNDRFEVKIQAALYLSLSLFNLLMTASFLQIVVSHKVLTIGFAKLIITAVIAVWNFLLFKFLIFSKRPLQAE